MSLTSTTTASRPLTDGPLERNLWKLLVLDFIEVGLFPSYQSG